MKNEKSFHFLKKTWKQAQALFVVQCMGMWFRVRQDREFKEQGALHPYQQHQDPCHDCLAVDCHEMLENCHFHGLSCEGRVIPKGRYAAEYIS